MRTAILPGSFDPITSGHVDLIRRAAKLCERLVVGVLHNDEKSCVFTVSKRIELIKKACMFLPDLEVLSFSGLLVHFAAMHNADLIIRGVRSCRDLESETAMANANRAMMRSLETVFLPSLDGDEHISSTLVRQIASLGGDVTPFVPLCVAEALREKYADK